MTIDIHLDDPAPKNLIHADEILPEEILLIILQYFLNV